MLNRGFQIAGLLAVCMIIYLSIIPGDAQIRTGAPKELEHFVAYLAGAFAIEWAFGRNRRWPVVIIFFIALAGTLELIQSSVPGRTTKMVDWEASLLGAVFGSVFAKLFRKPEPAPPPEPRKVFDYGSLPEPEPEPSPILPEPELAPVLPDRTARWLAHRRDKFRKRRRGKELSALPK